jgi:outer membrane protein assembly factor BamB
MEAVTPGDILDFTVISYDRKNGKIQWKRSPRRRQPHEGTHKDGSWASNSPVTDGELIWAYFGSNGLYCLDMEGNLKWKKDLGDMQTKLGFGEGSSPALHGDTLVITWDHEGQSFIIALDKMTGEQLWKADRDEMTTWATPLVVENNGQAQVITNGTSRIRSYDLRTGDLLWESSGMTQNVIPSPVFGDGLVFLASGFRGNALQAIRLASAKGDVSGTDAIAWTYDRDAPYVPTPLLYKGLLYFLKTNSNILSCLDAQTGKVHYSKQRLDGINGVYASPTAVGDRVYILGRDGTAVVLRPGPEFEVLAVNELDDGFDASPALAGSEIFLRGRKHLYCISEQ